MPKLLLKVLNIWTVVVLLLGTFYYAEGQRIRTARVYKPRIYNNTRTQMNNRAVARAAARMRHKAKAKVRKLPQRSARQS